MSDLVKMYNSGNSEVYINKMLKSLNKTETPIFLSVVCSLFPRAIFLTFIVYIVCACFQYESTENHLGYKLP